MKELHNGHNHDGIDNKEHCLDMFAQADMFMQNIKDNTDGAFNLLKVYENDDDIADVIRIDASELVEIEKLSSPVFDELKKIEGFIKEKGLITDKDVITKYVEFLQENEKKSTEIFNNLLKKLK